MAAAVAVRACPPALHVAHAHPGDLRRSIQLIFLAITFRITSRSFIIRSISEAGIV